MTDINLKDLYQMFYEDPDFNGGLGGNPNDSKEEAAWDEAQSRFKQHKNNEKALKVGINQNKADEAKDDRKSFVRRKLLGKQQNPFAIATAKAKEMGYSDFSEGSEGNTKRGEIAEAIKEQKMKKQYEDLEEKWDKKPKHRGPWREAGSSTGQREKGRGYGPSGYPRWKRDLEKNDDYLRNHPDVDKFDVTNEDAVKHKETKDMNTAEMVVNSVLKDLASKGIIKSRGLKKAIPGMAILEDKPLAVLGLSKDMSIPAIAGLVGAGAMLAKVFKLQDDDDPDDDKIEKQVVDYMANNGDFFEGLASMCEFICQTKDGEEPCDESRGNRIMEAASKFHKAAKPVQKVISMPTVGAAPAGGGCS